jgi:hypothetical protein
MNIEKIDNGYLMTDLLVKRKADNLQEVFEELLFHFESKSKTFGGEMFGEVIILNKKPNTRKSE